MTDLTHYQRNLPHRLPSGESIFITFRLASSLPRTVVEQLRVQLRQVQQAESRTAADEVRNRRKRYFRHFDQLLDQATTGPMWLSRPDVAEVVKASLHHFDEDEYELICYCLMPNHVHLLVRLPEDAPPLTRTLQRLKGYSGRQANLLLNREGAFWQPESYDHVVRSGDEMQRIIAYVLENPVKAGLVADWQKWPHSYWRDI
ncbi:REP-associated tyrosine transposase [Hymenobacter latericus]|uniref:REP-associated tyrosine transposase n=1 Tax=Hymenobacter sp. YIM 151858-1 TaxID=2987688 RepID=UPI0022264A71|nr:transposase [Hymenobacter sp. YIM 151858-1]UYZ57991.1 transposase [Hymenobacter sp. YIM 151858-1]